MLRNWSEWGLYSEIYQSYLAYFITLRAVFVSYNWPFKTGLFPSVPDYVFIYSGFLRLKVYSRSTWTFPFHSCILPNQTLIKPFCCWGSLSKIFFLLFSLSHSLLKLCFALIASINFLRTTLISFFTNVTIFVRMDVWSQEINLSQ